MKKISIFAISPFPHYDILFNELEKKYELDIFYLLPFMKEYPWKKTKNTVNDTQSLYQMTRAFLKSDLAIICGWNSPKSLYLLFILIFFSKKTAFWSDTPIIKKENFIFYQLKRFILKYVYILMTGKEGIEIFSKAYNIKQSGFYDFPYPIALVDNVDSEEYNLLRNNLIVSSQDKIKLLISNRFLERKGYDVVLDTFKNLYKKGLLESFDITIIGTGELFEEYKNKFFQLNHTVKFLGWVEFEEYRQQIKSTDILLHASYFEQYGIPPLDAMAHGKLVIASNGVMSAVDRITNWENGILFEKGDSKELYNILLKILEEEKIIYMMGRKARLSSQSFTIKYNVKTIDKVIDR